MQVIKAPDPFNVTEFSLAIFLGGSIDMGQAENWQDKIAKRYQSLEDILLLNPRRDDWDSSWKQDPIPGTKFYEQVQWEIKAQLQSDIRVYWFTSDSKAPITLLELGGFGGSNPETTIVYCPKDFYRYGNVKIFCDKFEIKMTDKEADFFTGLEAIMDSTLDSFLYL